MFKSDFVGLFFPLSYPCHLGCTSYSSVRIGDRFEVREFICKMLKAIANHIIQKYSDKVWNTRRYSIHQNSYLNR